MKIKKILAAFTAAAMTLSCTVNALAVSDDIYSADSTALSQALTQMTDEERAEFVNEHLDIKLQHLSTLVTMTANRRLDLLAGETEAALADGVSAVEIKEAIYHSGAYCGLTRAAEALDAADAALAALGENTAYSSRITWSEDERQEKGLETQRFLFGSQIGTITDDMESSLKLQTLYLSGICFGDFYNRRGLSLYTREFLTLCTIAANGNCASQLSGHVSGDLSVGHDKDMLRAAVLLNEQYNGAEKTELALEVINLSTAELNENPQAEPEISENSVETSYTSDSEEILAIFDHFKSDDEDGYINTNLDAGTQELLNRATEAVINGTEIPTSDNAATQALIDIAVMTAEGGREDEIPAKVAESLAAGNTADTMLAVPLLTAPYNGFPRTLNMRGTLAAALSESAESVTESMTITMQIGNPVMTVNGADQNIDDNNTTPVVIDNRTLLPVRAFVEAIGGEVDWNNDTSTATLTYGDDVITLTIGSTTAYLNGEANTLDVEPVIINDRTMLPIRFIAESFGYTVLWSQEAQTVTIIDADTIENVFGQGDVNPAGAWFTGVSYLNSLTSYDEDMQIPSFGQVTFEPCTRTDWHYHDGGQILLVTEGVGVLGIEGEPARIMQAGDVILIPPGKRHFHAAINDSWFAHIAISVNPDAGTTNWFEKVSDEEYLAAIAEALETGTIREKSDTMFPIGEEFTADGYTGTIHKNVLVEYEDVYNCPEVDYFTMEAGARTSWHSHESGQIILVTDGTGLYQEEGGDI
ncbi:MAG: carboxymuconolactone decarboxylase family protein [Clostridia bacterium]|nr:carboxymuconolactone decarboxylase family protein [Clostridia bacterium]